MKLSIGAVVTSFGLILFATGCRTNLYVNFGNGTPDRVRVQSGKTGKEIEIGPDRFKRFPHSTGDLVVVNASGDRLRFKEIGPLNIEPRYRTVRDYAIVPSRITLNVMLNTNMLLYVLLPREKSVDVKIEQPKGYPKTGEKTGN